MLLIVENIVDILRKVGIRIVRFVVETMFENCFVGVLDTESQRMLQPLREVGGGTLAGDPDGERKGSRVAFFHSAARSYEYAKRPSWSKTLSPISRKASPGRACPSCA